MQDNSFFNDNNNLDQGINLKTYLSVEVNAIVNFADSFQIATLSSDDPWEQGDNLLLNYDFLAKECIEINDLNVIDFKNSLAKLKKHFQPIKEKIIKIFDSSRHANLFFGNDVDLFQKNVINQLYDYWNTKNRSNLYLSFLNVFSMFERSLGDLIYTFNTAQSNSIPFLLKDLVYDKTVLKMLGKSLCDLLAILIYTPQSLNLRNLLWHGFWQPNELNEDYIFLLIAIITSINFEISKKTITALKQRLKINLDEFSKRNLQNSQILENFSSSFKEECLFIIKNSKLIHNKEIWLKAFYETVETFDIIILLLPQIEHLLRKLYSLHNPSSHCQIAKMDEYYLTIDDLFMFEDQTNSTKNKLIDNLDPQLILFVKELFMYEDGPRLRDRASHGELNQREIPKYYADSVQFLSILLASIPLDLHDNVNLQRLEFFKRKFYLEYDSVYHPISILKNKVFNLIELSVDFFVDHIKKDLFLDSDSDLFIKAYEGVQHLSKKNFLFDPLSKFSLEHHWKITDAYSYVYRYDLNKDLKTNEIQLIRILVKMFDQVNNTLILVKEFLNQALLSRYNHGLRQRKRENIDSFFKYKNYFDVFLKLSLLILINFIENIIIQNNYANLYSPNSTEFIKVIKYFKNYLKVTENLNSKSGVNKWSECKNLIVESKENLFSNFLEILFLNGIL